MAGGVVGWLSLAWLSIILVDISARRASLPPPRLLQDIARVVLLAGAALAILAVVFHQPVGGLLATSGVLVAIIGFALRGMIADVFSGIAINMEHPFRIGDWVQLDGGVVGVVVEINWRATRLTTRDQISVVVPNGVIAGAKLINYSFPERHYRAQLKVALPASVPVERARRVLLAAVLGATRVLNDPRPEVQADGFDERGMVYVVRYWVGDYADDNPCRDSVAASIAHGLQQAGLAPAFPRREVAVSRRVEAASGGEIHDELHRITLFRDFAATELDALAAQVVEHRFQDGECLFAQGDPGGSLYLLAEGVLEVRLDDAVLDRMVPGEVLGEISLLTGQPRTASVVALTEGVAFEIRKEHLEPILRARPQLAEGLAALMVRRQRHNRERLAARRAQSEAAVEQGDLLVRLRAFFGL
ncbi:MAG: mechanosensitive ion channel family protein [Rhodospirillaceae bacterium]|nr:mechanosensitive ion channel family protein [Rhodospirillales bacterium]